MKRYDKIEGFVTNGILVIFMKRYNVLQFSCFIQSLNTRSFLLLLKIYDILERFCYLWKVVEDYNILLFVKR